MRRLTALVLAIGLTLIFGSLPYFAARALYHAWRLESTGERTQGTVVGTVNTMSLVANGKGGSTSIRPQVEFVTIDGVTVRFAANGRPYDFPEGRTVTVIYLPDRPAAAEIDNVWKRWAAPAIGTVLTVPVGFLILWAWVRYVRRQVLGARLRRCGRRILAEIDYVGTEMRQRTKTGRAAPRWQITARWTDPLTNREHVFSTGGLAGDPAPHIATRQIAVFIDPSDPGKYAMDLSFLPEAIR